MKMHNGFIVFVVVTVVGHVQSRASSGVSVSPPYEDDVDLQCPLTAIANTQFDVPFQLLNKQYECYKPTSSFRSSLNLASGFDTFQRIFKNGCAQESSVRTCISGVAGSTTACLNEMEGKMFDTVRDFVESSISAVCSNKSETIARAFGEELMTLSPSRQMTVVSCINAIIPKSAYNREPDQPAYTMRRYRAMKEARNCIKEAAHGAGGSTTFFEAFLDPLIGSMKCISPATEEIVLCKTLGTEDDAFSGIGRPSCNLEMLFIYIIAIWCMSQNNFCIM